MKKENLIWIKKKRKSIVWRDDGILLTDLFLDKLKDLIDLGELVL